jgi:hypothetical protein
MKGTVAEGVLPGLLRELYVGRRTGRLHFTQGKERRSVRFRRGNIVNAETNVATDYLGEVLVRKGLLSPADLARATEVVLREKKRLGEVFIELGIMDRDGLEDAMAFQVHEILTKVFALSEGTYEFEEQPEEAVTEELTLKLSTGELILEAVRQVQDPDVIRYALGDLDRVLAQSIDPLLRFQKITLSPADGFLLSRVDGTLSAREITQLIPLPAAETQKSLFGLLCTGTVEYTPDAPRKPRPAPPPTPAVAVPPPPPPPPAAAVPPPPKGGGRRRRFRSAARDPGGLRGPPSCEPLRDPAHPEGLQRSPGQGGLFPPGQAVSPGRPPRR